MVTIGPFAVDAVQLVILTLALLGSGLFGYIVGDMDGESRVRSALDGEPYGRVGDDGPWKRGPMIARYTEGVAVATWEQAEPRCTRRWCVYSDRSHTLADHLRGTVTAE